MKGCGFFIIGFQLAMLAKQIWRIMKNPVSHVASLLKARYSAQCDILDAKIGHPLLCLEKSLVSDQWVIRRGCHWVVGNGGKTRLVGVGQARVT